MVYHNFAIPSKFESQNFSKICPKMGEQRVTRFFQNFEVDIKITKISKIGSHHQNFEENS